MQKDDIARIPLHGKHGSGLHALIDASDLPLVEGFRWVVARIKGVPYVVASIRNPSGEWRQVRLHRLVMGVSDPEQFVNFKNQNTLDCRRSNLRVCTPAQSVCTRGILGQSKNEFKGVRKVGNRWYATVHAQRRCFNRGGFDTEREAALAYNIVARECFGEFARLNEVPLCHAQVQA